MFPMQKLRGQSSHAQPLDHPSRTATSPATLLTTVRRNLDTAEEFVHKIVVMAQFGWRLNPDSPSHWRRLTSRPTGSACRILLPTSARNSRKTPKSQAVTNLPRPPQTGVSFLSPNRRSP